MTQAIDKAEMLRQNLADDKCSKLMTEKCIRFAQKGLHSCYFSKDAYANMIKDSKYADNKVNIADATAVQMLLAEYQVPYFIGKSSRF